MFADLIHRPDLVGVFADHTIPGRIAGPNRQILFNLLTQVFRDIVVVRQTGIIGVLGFLNLCVPATAQWLGRRGSASALNRLKQKLRANRE